MLHSSRNATKISSPNKLLVQNVKQRGKDLVKDSLNNHLVLPAAVDVASEQPPLKVKSVEHQDHLNQHNHQIDLPNLVSHLFNHLEADELLLNPEEYKL